MVLNTFCEGAAGVGLAAGVETFAAGTAATWELIYGKNNTFLGQKHIDFFFCPVGSVSCPGLGFLGRSFPRVVARRRRRRWNHGCFLIVLRFIQDVGVCLRWRLLVPGRSSNLLSGRSERDGESSPYFLTIDVIFFVPISYEGLGVIGTPHSRPVLKKRMYQRAVKRCLVGPQGVGDRTQNLQGTRLSTEPNAIKLL